MTNAKVSNNDRPAKAAPYWHTDKPVTLTIYEFGSALPDVELPDRIYDLDRCLSDFNHLWRILDDLMNHGAATSVQVGNGLSYNTAIGGAYSDMATWAHSQFKRTLAALRDAVPADEHEAESKLDAMVKYAVQLVDGDWAEVPAFVAEQHDQFQAIWDACRAKRVTRTAEAA